MNLGLSRSVALVSLMSVACGDDVESGASTSTSESSSTDGSESESGTSFEPFDEEACAAAPTAGPVSFWLDLEGLPVSDLLFESYETDCSVVSMTMADGLLESALECADHGDAAHATTLSISAPPSGTPAWDVGDDVVLEAYIWDPFMTGGLADFEGEGKLRSGQQAKYAVLRAAEDGGFLAAGGEAGLGVLAPTLEIEVVGTCGEVQGCSADPDQPRQAMVGEPGGDPVLLTGGHRAEVELFDGTQIVIDAERFHMTSDCHSAFSHALVAWRLQP